MAETTATHGRLAETLAAGVPDRRARLAYGELRTVGGVELVPVAFVGYGVAVPVGAYIGGPDGVRFRPNVLALLWASIPVVGVLGWAISRIARAAG